jgi:hypothetical protein
MSGPINPDYYSNLIIQIEAATSCAQLQQIANEIAKTMRDQVAAINAQMAAIQPILALLSPPTSPDAAVSWIGNLISAVLTPMAKPYISYAAQLALMMAEIPNLLSAIENTKLKFPSCTINVTIP